MNDAKSERAEKMESKNVPEIWLCDEYGQGEALRSTSLSPVRRARDSALLTLLSCRST